MIMLILHFVWFYVYGSKISYLNNPPVPMVSQVKCQKIVKSCCDKNIQIKIDIKDMQGLLSYFWYSREINIEMNKKNIGIFDPL